MTTANISPKDVMTLRERTGLGMMDCKPPSPRPTAT